MSALCNGIVDTASLHMYDSSPSIVMLSDPFTFPPSPEAIKAANFSHSSRSLKKSWKSNDDDPRLQLFDLWVCSVCLQSLPLRQLTALLGMSPLVGAEPLRRCKIKIKIHAIPLTAIFDPFIIERGTVKMLTSSTLPFLRRRRGNENNKNEWN